MVAPDVCVTVDELEPISDEYYDEDVLLENGIALCCLFVLICDIYYCLFSNICILFSKT